MFLTRRQRAVGLIVALLLACFTGAVMAQQQLAAVQGTISDPSKALVPNVNVTVKNLDTGDTRTTTTNADGIYRVQGLAPGRYEVAAELTGFKKAVRSGLVLSVGATAGLNLRLDPGVVTETIEVTGGAPDIQTETASLSAVVEQQKLVDLPNLQRNVFQVAQLQPGINTMDPSATGSFGNYEYGPGLHASGTRDSGTAVMMDGANISSGPWSGTVVFVPNQDSVQEFEVIANNPSAEYGRNAGAAVSIVTKGGTNEFHGTAYEFYRNEKLNGRNAFEDPKSVKNPYKHNDFGGSLGGPIRRDHTFFFVSYERLRDTNQYGASTVVETKPFVDYVARTRPDSKAAQLLQKYQPIAYPTTGLQDLGSPAPGAGKWSDVPDGIMDVGTINLTAQDKAKADQFSGRLDHVFNSGNDRLRLTFYRTSLGGSSTPIRPAFDAPMPTNMTSLNVAESHTLGAAALNEFSFAYLRGHGEAGDPTPGVPTINFDDIPGFGVTFWWPITYTQNIFEFRDVVTINRGRHSFRMGAEYKHTNDNSLQHHWERPNYYFQSILDFADDEPWAEDRAVDPVTGLKTQAPGNYRTKEGALFVQDNWKVRSNLTLNLGLRWEVFGTPGKVGYEFNGIALGSGATRQEQMRTARAVKVDKLYNTDWNNVAPRLGFAWDPQGKGKLVVRGGFGVAYNRLGNTVWSDEKLDAPQFAHASANIDNGVPMVYSLGPDYAPNPAFGTGLDANGGIRGARVDLRLVDPQATTPYTYNWFLGMQRDLGKHFVLDVNYIGTSSHNWMSADGPTSENYNRYAGDMADGVLNRLNPSFGVINFNESRIGAKYNGLTVQLQRRMYKGLSFQAAYTFGKGTDTATSAQELTRPDLEKGPTNFDVRHRFAGNFMLEIPSPSQDPVVKRILGGWQLNGATIYQTGLPFSVISSRLDSNQDGTYRERPNAPTWGDSKSGLSNDDYLNGIFKASDFPLPATGRLGTLGRNTFRGPHYFATDLSLFKNVALVKKTKLQLRFEVFNVFNTTNLNNPNNNLTSSVFGRSTSAKPPRIVQLGAKLIF